MISHAMPPEGKGSCTVDTYIRSFCSHIENIFLNSFAHEVLHRVASNSPSLFLILEWCYSNIFQNISVLFKHCLRTQNSLIFAKQKKPQPFWKWTTSLFIKSYPCFPWPTDLLLAWTHYTALGSKSYLKRRERKYRESLPLWFICLSPASKHLDWKTRLFKWLGVIC